MNIGLIIVGDEILSGHRQDKHFNKVIEILQQRQLQLSWALFLPDDLETLVYHYQRTFAQPDLVFSCGGIGATPDDKTRQAAALALNVPLVLHPQAKICITEHIQKMAQQGKASPDITDPANQQRLQMGYFPQGADILPNMFNNIPGFHIQHHCFTPGFPEMAWDMIEWSLDHLYPELHGSQQKSLSVDIYQLPESVATPVLERIEQRWPTVRTFSLPTEEKEHQPAKTEFGVKGEPQAVEEAFKYLQAEMLRLGGRLHPH